MPERNVTLQRGRQNVDQIDGSRNSLSPNVKQKRRDDHQCTSRLKVKMFALINAILSMSTRTRELSKCALLSKESTQHMREILTSKICTEDTDRSGKLGMNHGAKLLTDR